MKRIFELFLLLSLLAGACSKKKQEPAKTAGKEENTETGERFEKKYFKTGELYTAGKLVNGKREGPWASWYQNGHKNSEAIYENGVMDGPYKVWHPNGQLMIEGQYTDGRENGMWYFFNEKGDTTNSKDFTNQAPDPAL